MMFRVLEHRVPVAQWIRRVPTEHEIPGSSPGRYVFAFLYYDALRLRNDMPSSGIFGGSVLDKQGPWSEFGMELWFEWGPESIYRLSRRGFGKGLTGFSEGLGKV